MRKLIALLLVPFMLSGQTVISTGNHRKLFTSSFTTPTFVAFTSNTPSAGGTTTVTSAAMTMTAGDFVEVICAGGAPQAPYTVSSSPSNTFETTGTVNDAGSTSGFFAFSVASGSTTFTCTAQSSVIFQSIVVVQYHPGSVTTYDGSIMNAVSTQNFTSSALTTSGQGLMTVCGHPNFAASTATAGSIGATGATLRTTVGNTLCEDTFPGGSQSAITGGITTTGGSGLSWGGVIDSFVAGTYWTQPTFTTSCNNTPGGGSTSSVSCTISSPTAGDYYVGYCRGAAGPASVTLTSSPSNTFTGIGLETGGSGGMSEGFYATGGAASGSTTFTCNFASSATFQGINVLEYHPGSLTGFDVSTHNGTGSSATYTSSTFSPTAKGLVVACADPLFGASTWSLPDIKVGPYIGNSRINTSFILCFDSPNGSPLTSVTASALNGASGPWQGAVVTFK